MIQSENTNVYSLEVSLYGYKPDPKAEKIVPYTEENCEIITEFIINCLSRYSSGQKYMSSTVGLLQNIRAYRGL